MLASKVSFLTKSGATKCGTPTEADKEMIKRLQLAAARKHITEMALAKAQDPVWRKNALGIYSSVTNSQLGILRMWAMRLSEDEDKYEKWRTQVVAWVAAVRKKAPPWPDEPAMKQIEKLFGVNQAPNQRTTTWELLLVEDTLNALTLPGGLTTSVLRACLWPYAMKCIVDAAVRAHSAEGRKPHG